MPIQCPFKQGSLNKFYEACCSLWPCQRSGAGRCCKPFATSDPARRLVLSPPPRGPRNFISICSLDQSRLFHLLVFPLWAIFRVDRIRPLAFPCWVFIASHGPQKAHPLFLGLKFEPFITITVLVLGVSKSELWREYLQRNRKMNQG